MAERLKHGYTNDTSTDGRRVIKRYRGPDAEIRRRREVAVYTGLRDRLPLPVLLDADGSELVLQHVSGVPGQELLERKPQAVLRSVGVLARTISLLDLDQLRLPAATPADGPVLVHGDFGPQNLLLDAGSAAPTAVVDWELAHYGSPVEDIAWAEWIVRMHHSPLLDHLSALFDGFGDRPAWDERQAVMINKCHWALDFVERWEPGSTATSRMWRDRLRATHAFSEI